MPLNFSEIVSVAGQVADIAAEIAAEITGAYSAGDLIGSKITLTNAARYVGGSGRIQSLALADAAAQKSDIDVIFFNADPDSTTFSDDAELAVDDADLGKIIGCVSIDGSTDYIEFADNAVAIKPGIGIGFQLPAGRDLYACLVCRGTPTYVAANDLLLRVNIIQD